MAFKMKKFSGFKESPMKKDEEPRKGSLSWGEVMKGGAVDVWKDAKEKKAAKEQTRKDNYARDNQAPGSGGMMPI